MAGKMKRQLPIWFPVWLVPWALCWAAVLGVIWAFGALKGVPYMRMSYESIGRGEYASTVCEYLGPVGLWRVEARDTVPRGCPSVLWVKW